jgi:hypothetical protein
MICCTFLIEVCSVAGQRNKHLARCAFVPLPCNVRDGTLCNADTPYRQDSKFYSGHRTCCNSYSYKNKVHELELDDGGVDVLIIRNTPETPYYLSVDYHDRDEKHYR